MSRLWSKTKKSFVIEGIHDTSLAVELPHDHFLFTGIPEGKRMFVGNDGLPALEDIPGLTPEEEFLIAWDQIKKDRAAAVEAIKVTVDGMEFDGDETSQGRMTRAVTVLNEGETTLWKLSNNTIAFPTREQLKEALRLAGLVQTQIWGQYVL